MRYFVIFLLSSSAMALTPTQEIVRNPYAKYKEFSARLHRDGPNASFPELKPTVDKLLSEVQSERTRAVINAHPALRFEQAEIVTMLGHVNLDFEFDHAEIYPYPRPFPGIFPYRPTIDAIEQAVRFFDHVSRLSDDKAVPLYHFDRYAYHRHSLLADPNIVIFPTSDNLGFRDLLAVRGVPIGFVGVVTHTTRVDRHMQSPLDFWYHDLNHVRRMMAYTELKVKSHHATTHEERLKVYAEMDQFVREKILPLIAPLPKGSAPEAIAVTRLIRVIFFEILHETALAADRDSILEDLFRPPNTPQPFEHMLAQREFSAKDIEGLRTATGNIASGLYRMLRSNDEAGEPVVIRYFHDRALGLLANVYNKINFGFFDDVNDPSQFVAPVEYRKADYLVRAVQSISKSLDFTPIPSARAIRNLILSKEGNPEKFIYQRLQAHEADTIQEPQYVTEPMGADEIIRQIRALNKTVYTLFGYSKLGYQNKDQVLAQIRAELAPLDRASTIINIGATEDGIGAAYETAKSMGFQTMGIVSVQALSYSGRFSPSVDRIYIVNDQFWGGLIPGTNQLTPATRVFVESSDVISAHGGGLNTAASLIEATRLNKKVIFTPAEMNHESARAEGNTEFSGAAAHAWTHDCGRALL